MEFAIVFITAKYKEQNIKCITLLVFLIVCGLCCRYLLVEVSAWRVQTGAVHLSVFSRMERGRLQYVVSHTSFTRLLLDTLHRLQSGARWSSVVRAFAHGAMGCQIDPPWGGPIELFLVPASAPQLV